MCRYKENFELTYVSKNAVIVKSLTSGSRTVLKSGTPTQVHRITAAIQPFKSLCHIGYVPCLQMAWRTIWYEKAAMTHCQ